jgi:5,10-methylenetetrahydrofolate reductase
MAFRDDLSARRFLKLVELRPPKGVVLEPLLDVAGRLRGRVDAVVVTDNAGAVMTACPIPVARRLVEQGHEVVLHVSCRDRNRLAVQSVLLGAAVEGVRNIMVTRGLDGAYGDHPRARMVYDLEPHEVIKAARVLGEGKDLGGSQVDGTVDLLCGAEVNPWLEHEALDEELREAARRVEAGARFLITPAVHDIERLAPFLGKIKALGAPVFARVLLIKSVGMARYLTLNIAGCRIPDEAIKRLRKAPDKVAESLRIAAEVAADLRKICDGVCFIPLGWEAHLPALMDQV